LILLICLEVDSWAKAETANSRLTTRVKKVLFAFIE